MTEMLLSVTRMAARHMTNFTRQNRVTSPVSRPSRLFLLTQKLRLKAPAYPLPSVRSNKMRIFVRDLFSSHVPENESVEICGKIVYVDVGSKNMSLSGTHIQQSLFLDTVFS